MDLNKKFAINKDVVHRIVDGEAIILDMNNGEHFSLNRTGTDIFLGILEDKNLKSILELQTKKYKENPEVLKKDLISCVSDLLRSKIIKKTGGVI
jgi:hypothetical protein